jgi:pSer/pThr/pTyr-binding forkhead associated (FHA) protein/biotin carboxyl carrier protein
MQDKAKVPLKRSKGARSNVPRTGSSLRPEDLFDDLDVSPGASGFSAPIAGAASGPTRASSNSDAARAAASEALGALGELRVETGALKNKVVPLGVGTTVVGRSSKCEICLRKSAGVSRRHCKFQFVDGVFVVIDLESRNGTLVNGVPVTRHVLAHNDVVEVSEERIRFVSHREDRTSAPGRVTNSSEVGQAATHVLASNDPIDRPDSKVGMTPTGAPPAQLAPAPVMLDHVSEPFPSASAADAQALTAMADPYASGYRPMGSSAGPSMMEEDSLGPPPGGSALLYASLGALVIFFVLGGAIAFDLIFKDGALTAGARQALGLARAEPKLEAMALDPEQVAALDAKLRGEKAVLDAPLVDKPTEKRADPPPEVKPVAVEEKPAAPAPVEKALDPKVDDKTNDGLPVGERPVDVKPVEVKPAEKVEKAADKVEKPVERAVVKPPAEKAGDAAVIADTLTVRTNTAGKVGRVNVRAGEKVKAGTVLVALESDIPAGLKRKLEALLEEERELEEAAKRGRAQAAADLPAVRAELKEIEKKARAANIATAKSGTVLELLVRPGDVLKRGQPVARVLTE